MEKKIISEIKRIHEIMGLKKDFLLEGKKPLLSEQVVPTKLVKGVINLGTDVLDDIMKLFKNETDDALKIAAKEDKALKLAQKIENAKKTGKAVGDDVYEEIAKYAEKRGVAELIRSRKLLGKVFAEEEDEVVSYITKLIDEGKINENQINNLIQKFYRKKLDEVPLLNGMDEIKDELSNTLNSRIKELNKGKFKSKLESEMDQVLNDKEVKSAEAELDNIIKKGVETEKIKQTYINLAMRTFAKFWRNAATKNSKLLKEIENLDKIIAEKIKQGKDVTVDVEDLFQKIAGLRKNKEQVVTGANGLNERIKDKYPDQWEKLMQSPEFKASYDALLLSEEKNAWGPFLEQMKAYFEMFPILNYVVNYKNIALNKNWWRILFPDVRRIVNFVIWKDPRSTSEVLSHLYRRGAKNSFFSKIGFWIIANHVVVPYALAYIKQIKANYEYNRVKLQVETMQWMCEYLKQNPDYKGNDCNDLDSLLVKKPTDEDFKRYFKESLPFDYFGLNPLGEGAAMGIIKNVPGAFTYIDEIAGTIWDCAEMARTGDFSEERYNKFKNQIDFFYKNKLKEAGVDLENLTTEAVDKLQDVKQDVVDFFQDVVDKVTSEGLESGFKLFAEKKKLEGAVWNKEEQYGTAKENGVENDYSWDSEKKTFTKIVAPQ